MKILKYKPLFFGISLLLLVSSVLSILSFGFKVGIDFTGGALLELSLQEKSTTTSLDTTSVSNITQSVEEENNTPLPEISSQAVKEKLNDHVDIDNITQAQDGNFILKSQQLSNDQKKLIISILGQDYGVEEVRFISVGPTMGRELITKTLNAVILVSLIIIIYVWSQFNKFSFGICAILAMFHDSIILLGFFSLFGRFFQVEVDVLFVTALLTTLSFSIHDTIVIYHRIEELSQQNPSETLEDIANSAIWDTLTRSINNSVTIFITLLALVLLGGRSIFWFSTALLIGAIIGTYSSTFTAVPLLVTWTKRFANKNGK